VAFIDDDHLIGSIWRVLRARAVHVHVHFLEPIYPRKESLTRDQVARIAEQRIRLILRNAA
jgi:hypothetical protein